MPSVGRDQKIGLPAEGLLGAARLALRVALRAIAAAAARRRRRTRLFVCRGFELRTVICSNGAAVSRLGCGAEGFE